MKILLPLVSILAFFTTAIAQNLVPNPGFETYSACVTSSSQVNRAVPWDSPPSQTGTPDFMHACMPSGNQTVPTNFYGSQAPRENNGQGYMGMITYYSGSVEVCEYLQAPLIAPLQAGVSYNVGFHISRSDNFRWATDRIGILLSNGAATGSGNFQAMTNYTPQIENPAGAMLIDATSWEVIGGIYTAGGGETHITIGNFRNEANTQIQDLGTGLGWAYYYIDSVFVLPVTVLPVELARFGAVKEGSQSLLTWESKTEQALDIFEVERAGPDGQFRKIGSVKAKGNSQELLEYDFTDRYPQLGDNTYRLKMIDMDGSHNYSLKRTLHFEREDLPIWVSPNPFQDQLFLHFAGLESSAIKIKLIDSKGAIVWQSTEASVAAELKVNTAELAAGMYILEVQSEFPIYRQKLLKR